jgi:hypothetical protein
MYPLYEFLRLGLWGRFALEAIMDGRTSALTMGRIRGGRDDGRPSEDDLAKARLGEQGVPNRPPKPQTIDDDRLQNPKPIEPGGHAA